jgi:hypothetical protein
MTKTKRVRQFAGVTGADLQVFAQRCCQGLRDWNRRPEIVPSSAQIAPSFLEW